MKALSVADRWLLGLCILPLIYFLLMVYRSAGGIMALFDLTNFAGYLYWLFPMGCAVIIPIVAALRQGRALPRILYVLWGAGLFIIVAETGNYLRLLDGGTMPGGFFWVSELHIALRIFQINVTDGYWFPVLRFILWLAITVLFVRKCQLLSVSAQYKKVETISCTN